MASKWTRTHKRVSRDVAAIDIFDTIPHATQFYLGNYEGKGVTNLNKRLRKAGHLIELVRIFIPIGAII